METCSNTLGYPSGPNPSSCFDQYAINIKSLIDAVCDVARYAAVDGTVLQGRHPVYLTPHLESRQIHPAGPLSINYPLRSSGLDDQVIMRQFHACILYGGDCTPSYSNYISRKTR